MQYRIPLSSAGRRKFMRKLGAVAAGCSFAAATGGQPQEPPAPPPRRQAHLPAASTRVQIGEDATDGPTWLLASRSLQIPWREPGGDWTDAENVANGPTAHATFAVRDLNPEPVDVTSIVKLLQVENTGILLHMAAGGTPPSFMSRRSAVPPRLSITTDQGQFDCPCIANCWIHPTSNQTLGGAASDSASFFRPSAMLRFDLAGVDGTPNRASLKLAVHKWWGPATVVVDYLDMPLLITDPANQIGGARHGIAATVANDRDLAAHPDIIFYSECSSEGAIKSKWSYVSPYYPGKRVCINPQFVQWPEIGLARFAHGEPISGQHDPG